MRVLRVLTVTLFAFVTCIGAVLAADDPLEIHGGGRVGVMVNGNGGADGIGNYGPSNFTGYMPDYGQTRYWSLSFSKKYKGDDGSYAQVSTAIDKWTGSTATDLRDQAFRFRDAHVEFGGLDFLPAGSVLWAGLRGYGQGGYNMMQDHGFIDLNGIGFGLDKIGGVASIAYMKEDSTNGITKPWLDSADPKLGLGVQTLHNFILGVNVPMADVYAALGYAPKDPKAAGAKDLTQYYLGGVVHLPVGGLNVGAIYATGSYAANEVGGTSDTILQGGASQYSGSTDANKYTDIALTAWSITDIMPGLYIAPAIRADFFTVGKGAADVGDNKVKDAKDTSYTNVGLAVKLSKALTKHIAIVPEVGAYYTKGSYSGAKAYQYYQQTLAVEIALSHGFWSGPKIQFYVSEAEVNSDAKKDKQWLGAGYDQKAAGTLFGCLVTYGF
jgi:maltoporin